MEQIPDKDLKDIINQLEGQHKDVDRLRIVRRVCQNYRLSTDQVKELLKVMHYGKAAIGLVELSHAILTDPDNFASLLPLFPYDEDRDEIRARLKL